MAMMTERTGGALALVIEGRDTVVAQACGVCGRVYSPTIFAATPERAMKAARSAAEECCAIRKCGDCGVEIDVRPAWGHCPDCRRKRKEAYERDRFKEATVVEWDGGSMLYDAGNDRWISERWEVEEADPPIPYAYATTPRRLHIGAIDIIENALDNGEHHEDAEMEISDIERDELQAFLDGWCERTGVVSYFPDYSRVVVFDTPDAEINNEKAALRPR